MKFFLMLFTVFALVSCIESKEIKPKDPIWGRENCARCRMVLSEKRYAVQRILSNGEVYFYDDLNCALEHKHEEEGSLYVHPHGGDGWVLAQEVRYQSGLRSPMNSGYGAVIEGGDTNFSEIQEKFKE